MLTQVLLGAAVLLSSEAPTHSPGPGLTVTVDHRRHEVTIRSGPYTVAAGMGHGDHHDMSAHQTPLYGFSWPVHGWLRGFRVEVTDGEGRALPREMLHHLNLLNLDRRQLLDPAVERLLAVGQETGPVMLPSSVGIPLTPQTRLGLVAAWANRGAADIADVWLTVVFRFIDGRQVPAPLAVLPVGFDVGYEVGKSDVYDLPAGRSIRTREFVMPLDARLLAAGGHLHQYGVSLRLEDTESGRIVIELKPEKGPLGEIRRMPVKFPGAAGNGILLRAGHQYRIVGEYDNTSGVTIPDGAMAVMAALLRPGCLDCWPAVVATDAHYMRDIATLPGNGWAGINWLEKTSSD